MLHPGSGADRLLGLTEPVSLRAFVRTINRDHRRALFSSLRAALADGASEGKVALDTPGAEIRHFRIAISRIGNGGDAADLDITLVDVTREFVEIDLLRRSEENLRNIVEYNPQLPWIADAQGNVIDFTDRWLANTGLERSEAFGSGWVEATHPDDAERVARQIQHACETGEAFDTRVRLMAAGEYRWMRAQGYPRFNDDGTIMCWYGYTEDIHENVLVEEQIRWNAEHDPLTGLANRALFSSALDKALARAMTSLEKVGVLMLDIDNFKDVNDLMGHQAGDQLLQHFAVRLGEEFGASATIARLGGDEFGILIQDFQQREELPERANPAFEIRECLLPSGRTIDCRVSMGGAVFPEDGTTATELMRHSDLALYHAKAQGKGQLQLFEKSLLNDFQERVAMVNRARTAVREGTILTYYQPKVSLSDGRLAGFEALLRWRDARGNIRSPAEIYAAFDDHDVADMIGQTMTRQVFEDMNIWKSQGLEFGHVAINVSSAELRRENFVDRLLENIQQHSIDVNHIEIEITEGVFLGSGSNTARKAIDSLYEHNIPMALDDFGTGFASLSHLKSLPVSTLKIDRSFVMHMAARESDHAIVSALITLGKALHMKVVAEGIEYAEQAEALRNLGCEYAQGFLFSKPAASESIPELIRSWGKNRTDPAAGLTAPRTKRAAR